MFGQFIARERERDEKSRGRLTNEYINRETSPEVESSFKSSSVGVGWGRIAQNM